MAQTKKAGEKAFRIVRCNTLADIIPCQILVTNTTEVSEMDSIYEHIKGKQTLLIAENLGDYKLSMISFMMRDSKMMFIINKTKLDASGLIVDPKLAILGISKEEWASIFDKYTAQLNGITNDVKVDKADLEEMISTYKKIEKERDEKLHEMEKLSGQIKSQTQELAAKQQELKTTEARTEEQKAALEKQKQDIDVQTAQIDVLRKSKQDQQDLFDRKQEELVETGIRIEAQKKVLHELNLKMGKQEVELEDKSKHISTQDAEINKQRIIITTIALLSAGVLILLFFAIRTNNQRKKANRKLAEQKSLVEAQKHEITDSINYARRLQSAIFPSTASIAAEFPDSFVLFKPKDIVSGDFYWMEQSEGRIFISAADSTGHGVPGAMVSIVCSNALNRAVKEYKLRDTGGILDKTRELVLETFAKSSNEVKDGMDISLLAVDKKEQKVFWSGANNQLWCISAGELKEIKPDKQPIGLTDTPRPFTTHGLALNKGDAYYLITDGYADQFGGPKGKKFKYKPLQELLLANAGTSMEGQKSLLNETFENWRGSLEQVDDVTIIGIRV